MVPVSASILVTANKALALCGSHIHFFPHSSLWSAQISASIFVTARLILLPAISQPWQSHPFIPTLLVLKDCGLQSMRLPQSLRSFAMTRERCGLESMRLPRRYAPRNRQEEKSLCFSACSYYYLLMASFQLSVFGLRLRLIIS